MERLGWALFLALGLVAAGCAGVGAPAPQSGDAGRGPDDAGPGGDGGAQGLGLDELVATTARATCSALFRCCNTASVDQYFFQYRNNNRLEAMASRFPPTTPLTEAACPALLEEAFQLVPWGPWIEAARAGRVVYDPHAAAGCIAELDSAACGDDVTSRLFDGTCTGFGPPAGGPHQRRMFVRGAMPGAECTALTDGVGAALYGTCDPDVSFCCFTRDGGPGCMFPREGEVGTCRAVSTDGESCSTFPLQLCATGADCNPEAQTCTAPVNATLQGGDECATSGFSILGECVSSWCDVLGTRRCEPLRADNEACQGGSECASGACVEGTCGSPTFCRGT